MYNLIYLKNDIIVNKNSYSDFYEIQDLYTDYKANLYFNTCRELLKFLIDDFDINKKTQKIILDNIKETKKDFSLKKLLA